jgi:hypothetical protein
MSNIHVLHVGNDAILEVQNLKNELSGASLNAATVTVTLVDADGEQVTGDTWPKTMAYVAGSNGTYRCTLVYGLGLVDGERYTAQITANAGAGLRAVWDMECVARPRG